MSQKPVLVIMAAGMGSRYGGLKQIDPVDREGDLIIDFSIFDAVEAGFEKVVFIIKKSIEKEFKEHIGNRMEKHVQVEYVYQENDRLPDGFEVPEGRVKPWGTGHAILCCSEVIDGPFAVINADDYYGKSAFKAIYDRLASCGDDDKYQYAMVAYHLYNTLTENGHVARGVCTVDADGHLADIHERTRIEKHGDQAEYTEDDGATWEQLGEDTLVSMNLWGFSTRVLDELWARMGAFLTEAMKTNPLKCEYFLPFVVNEQLADKSASVQVLPCEETWYGVTYREDLASVKEAVARMKAEGIYTEELWK